MIKYFEGLCKSTSKDGLQEVSQTFGDRKDSCHELFKRSYKRRRQGKKHFTNDIFQTWCVQEKVVKIKDGHNKNEENDCL